VFKGKSENIDYYLNELNTLYVIPGCSGQSILRSSRGIQVLAVLYVGFL